MSKIIIICGPSGSGKGTVVGGLVEKKQLNLYWARTATTRAPRSSDSISSRRIFMDRDEFEKLWVDGKIIERNEFAGHLYGSLYSEIEDHPHSNIILEADINGVLALKNKYGSRCLTIFVHSKVEDLKRRLRLRGMPDRVIDTRLKIARGELEREKQCDVVVVNREGHPNETIENAAKIIHSFLEDR